MKTYASDAVLSKGNPDTIRRVQLAHEQLSNQIESLVVAKAHGVAKVEVTIREGQVQFVRAEPQQDFK